MRRAMLGLVLFLVPAAALHAQSERQTAFMVHQYSICPGPNMAEVNRLSALSVPVLEALQDEGMIRAWYDLRHGWGDEWNVVFVSVADSHRAWLDFWAEYLRRMNAIEPGIVARYGELCTLHKDNFYSVRDSRSGA